MGHSHVIASENYNLLNGTNGSPVPLVLLVIFDIYLSA